MSHSFGFWIAAFDLGGFLRWDVTFVFVGLWERGMGWMSWFGDVVWGAGRRRVGNLQICDECFIQWTMLSDIHEPSILVQAGTLLTLLTLLSLLIPLCYMPG